MFNMCTFSMAYSNEQNGIHLSEAFPSRNRITIEGDPSILFDIQFREISF